MFNFSGKRRNYLKVEIEAHEVLLDKLAKKKEEVLGISAKKFETPIFRPLQILFYFLISLILILFLRTFQFQVLEGKHFNLKAQANKYVFHQIQAQRGVIYDRNFKQLVFNREIFNLVCKKDNLPKEDSEKEKILAKVSQILKIDQAELQKKIEEEKNSTVLILENLDHKSLIVLETKINELPGFEIVRNSVRDYWEGENFSHLIGYMEKISSEELKKEPGVYSILDYVGRTGIEESFEKILRKNPGEIKIERDALGNVISQEVVSLPQSGKSLVLWLDASLQKKIKEFLQKKLQEVGSKKAAAVALDPKTGGVLSLVSLPEFDNNLFQNVSDPEALQKLLKDPLSPLFNRAISGQYLIGSTIKPLIALAALEEKIISPQKMIYDPGFIKIPHRYDPEKVDIFEDWAIHGWTDMRKAIAESCNVYFYTIGGGYGEQEGLGPTKIKKYLELFGWGQLLPIDLPLQQLATGLIPDPEWKKRRKGEDWWDGDTYNFSIGQGYILVTPLQVANAFSAIANGGKLLKPQVVQKIIDPVRNFKANQTSYSQKNEISNGVNSEKNLIEEIQPKVIRENFISPETLQIVREGMRWAVTGQNSPQATATLLNDLPVKVAAKTGTAQVGRDYYNIWITVFAPYDDPQIVLTLVIEDVKELRSQIIVPVAKEILNWYFTR